MLTLKELAVSSGKLSLLHQQVFYGHRPNNTTHLEKLIALYTIGIRRVAQTCTVMKVLSTKSLAFQAPPPE